MNSSRRMKCFLKIAAVSVFTFVSLQSIGQGLDTLKVMTYNLMYYREVTSFCTSTNNNSTTKDNAMEDIIDHVLPDILVVNEMGGSNSVKVFRLLSNALNQKGRSYYSLAN